jgi:hypothetical protein
MAAVPRSARQQPRRSDNRLPLPEPLPRRHMHPGDAGLVPAQRGSRAPQASRLLPRSTQLVLATQPESCKHQSSSRTARSPAAGIGTQGNHAARVGTYVTATCIVNSSRRRAAVSPARADHGSPSPARYGIERVEPHRARGGPAECRQGGRALIHGARTKGIVALRCRLMRALGSDGRSADHWRGWE